MKEPSIPIPPFGLCLELFMLSVLLLSTVGFSTCHLAVAIFMIIIPIYYHYYYYDYGYYYYYYYCYCYYYCCCYHYPLPFNPFHLFVLVRLFIHLIYLFSFCTCQFLNNSLLIIFPSLSLSLSLSLSIYLFIFLFISIFLVLSFILSFALSLTKRSGSPLSISTR